MTSLYPAEQMMRKFPKGIPKIHFYTWAFRPCYNCQDIKNDSGEFILECACREFREHRTDPKKGYGGTVLDLVDCRDTQPTAEQFINDDDMFGFVCCDLTPPTNLYHPVVQIKKDIMKDGRKIGEKCQNNLLVEDHKKLYLDTPTLKKCLESGYKLDFCYRFDKYLKGDPLWKEGAMEFYIDKERTSGKKPSATERGEWCRDYLAQTGLEADNDLDAYVKLYNNQVDPLGTKLLESMDTLEWADRPAQRQCFKIFNNCGWGKHAQRPVMPKTKMLHAADDYPEIAAMFENLTKDLIELKGCLVYSKGERLMFSTLDKNTPPDHHNSYIPAGAMVPAYGRLTLLEGLEICGERVAMCDTDSIVYKTSLDPTKNIPISSVLGNFSEEKISLKIIREFVGFGPKCYSILTEKVIDVEYPDRSIKRERLTETKLKGVRQTLKVQGIDHAFMKNQVLHYLETGEIPTTYVPQWGMKTNLAKLTVGPHDFAKTIKMSNADEIKGFRKELPGGHKSSKIYPYGYTQ